jgi:nucleoside 2-deoxyribosyltransferase
LYKLSDVQLYSIIKLFDQSQSVDIKVFVAMPYYNDEIIRSTNAIYSRVINKIRNVYNIDISLPGKIMTYEGSTVNIVNDVLARIENCDICFCDITGNNPNVTYEMGWARALKKHVVILKEESKFLPFN